MLIFGCGQVPGQHGPAALASAGEAADGGAAPPAAPPDAGAPATVGLDAGTLDAGSGAAAATPVDRYCDPGLDAAAGIVITDTSACPGIMPAAPSCAADLQLCPGWSPSGTGIYASAATSDAQGAIAVACTSHDSGATMYRLGLASARYTAAAQLGEAVAPLQNGFAAPPLSRPAPVRFFAHDGTQLASLALGAPAVVVTPAGVEILSAVRVAGGLTLTAQLFGPDGSAKGNPQPLGEVATAFGVGMAGAADPGGQVLVTWSIYDPFATYGRWLGPDGAPLSAPFEISAWAGHATASAALPGGGIAVGDNDAAGVHWRGVLGPGSTRPAPVPAWLATRGDFTLVRGGRAALFGGSEVVAADGALCGTLRFADRLPTRAGADGTVFHPTADGKGFRVYPQLLR